MTYPGTIALSTAHLTRLADLLRAHRHRIGSRWRKLQGLGDPRRGDLVWISDGLPGSTHDLTAARVHDVVRCAARADVDLLADNGYHPTWATAG